MRFFLVILLLLSLASPALALTVTDPYFSKQTYLNQIRIEPAWDIITGTNDVVVAVLDTGVDLDHPDLRDNIWINHSEIAGDGVDNDGNGYIDDINGWDFLEHDNTPVPNRTKTYTDVAVIHGTMIAGVIGAVANNSEGVAGINWKVKIMSLRILDSLGSGDATDVVTAITYAVNNGADVINLSFTGYDTDEALRQAVADAYSHGVTVVAAVGNQSNGGLDVDLKPIYPACFKNENGKDWVIGVAAVTFENKKAGFSNYGANCVDISAPGVNIFNTIFQDANWPDYSQALYGDQWSGTSIAAPMVSGAAALLKAKYPGLTPGQIETILQLSVSPLNEDNPLYLGKLGPGVLNIGQAFSVAVAGGFVGAVPAAPVPEETVVAPLVQVADDNIVVGVVKGAPPWVDVFSANGALKISFNAYAAEFSGGVRTAVGDVDGDGQKEIVTVPGSGGGPHVRIFETDGSLRAQFFAFEKTTRSGLFVAIGDVNGDGQEEIIVSEDAGGVGRVAVFHFNGEQISSFVLPDPAKSIRVAAADVDGDGQKEIITARGNGLAPKISVWTMKGVLKSEFLAYGAGFTRGVFVSGGDLNSDGKDEIITGTEIGGGPQVRVFDGVGTVQGSFFAFDQALRDGVQVATSFFRGRLVIVAKTVTVGVRQIKLVDLSGNNLGGFSF